jgi:hypothetical protein
VVSLPLEATCLVGDDPFEEDEAIQNMNYLIETCGQLQDRLQDLTSDVNEMRDGVRQWKRQYISGQSE